MARISRRWVVDRGEVFAHSIDLQGIGQIFNSFVFDMVVFKVQHCESLRRKWTSADRSCWVCKSILLPDWSSRHQQSDEHLHVLSGSPKSSIQWVSANSAQRWMEKKKKKRRSPLTWLIFNALLIHLTPSSPIWFDPRSSETSVYKQSDC